jgi:hypothetical protein
MWVNELLVNLPSLISKLQHAPLPPEVLRANERAPTPSPSVVFTFGLLIESIKELGGVSLSIYNRNVTSIKEGF